MRQVATKQGWKLKLSSNGAGRIYLNCVEQAPLSVDFADSAYTFKFELGVKLVISIKSVQDSVTLFPVLTNEGDGDVAIGNVELIDLMANFRNGFSHVYVNGKNMVENTGLVALSGKLLSNSVLGLTDAAGTQAFAVGAIRPDDAWYDFYISADEGIVDNFKIICQLENTLLSSNVSRKLSPIRFYSGSSLACLINCYAEDTAEQMAPLNQFKDPPSGWCSWYHYYGTDDASEIRKNMLAIKASPLKDHLDVIQIDDGWNLPLRDSERCWGDWLPGGKYPEGIKALADEIHSNGFKAGLWLAPFSADAASQLCRNHPDWLVQRSDPGGELDPLAAPGGVFGLDLTQPEVQEFIRSTFRRVFHEWNFDYIKIDFISHGAMEGRRADQSKTGIEAFRIGMRIIREEAGPDKFILNCGSPITAAIGLCDGMRIGMDVGGRWFAPMNLKEWHYGNCCIKAAANSTIWRQWMHRIWWHNDPDCLVLRDTPVPEELKKFVNNPFQNRQIDIKEFGLTREEFGCWLRLVWMSGGMFILSEDVAAIPVEKLSMLEEMCRPNPQPICWIDDYRNPGLGLLRTISGPLMVGLFNLSDKPVDLSLDAEKLGLSTRWKFTERLSLESFSGQGTEVSFPQIPPHAGRIWMFQSIA